LFKGVEGQSRLP